MFQASHLRFARTEPAEQSRQCKDHFIQDWVVPKQSEPIGRRDFVKVTVQGILFHHPLILVPMPVVDRILICDGISDGICTVVETLSEVYERLAQEEHGEPANIR